MKASARTQAPASAALDREAGVPAGTIHDIESGRVENPSFARVTQIVRVLQRRGLKGITGEQLFPVAHVQPREEAAS